MGRKTLDKALSFRYALHNVDSAVVCSKMQFLRINGLAARRKMLTILWCSQLLAYLPVKLMRNS